MRLPITIFIGRDKSKNGKQWMFRVRFADGGKPFKKFYATEREAKELKAFFEKAALTTPMAEIRRRLEEAEGLRRAAPTAYPTSQPPSPRTSHAWSARANCGVPRSTATRARRRSG